MKTYISSGVSLVLIWLLIGVGHLHAMTFQRDAQGRLTQCTLTHSQGSGSMDIHYSYDGQNGLQSMTTQVGAHVLTRPEDLGLEPTNVQSGGLLHVSPGDVLEINLLVGGSPAPTVTWSWPTAGPEETYTGASIITRPIRFSDHDTFLTAEVVNEHGSQFFMIQLAVDMGPHENDGYLTEDAVQLGDGTGWVLQQDETPPDIDSAWMYSLSVYENPSYWADELVVELSGPGTFSYWVRADGDWNSVSVDWTSGWSGGFDYFDGTNGWVKREHQLDVGTHEFAFTAAFEGEGGFVGVGGFRWLPSRYGIDLLPGPGGVIELSPDGLVHAYGAVVEFTAIPDEGYEFIEWTEDLWGTENPQEVSMFSNQFVGAVFRPDLPTWMGGDGIQITTGGDVPWVIQGNVVHDGSPWAAGSSNTAENSVGWIEATVSGPAILRYWRSVSSRLNFDYLRVTLNGEFVEQRSGEIPWEMHSLRIPAGDHVVRWAYERSNSWSLGQNAAFVDGIVLETDSGFGTWSALDLLPADRRGPLDRNGPLGLPNLMSHAMGLEPLSGEPSDLPRIEDADPADGKVWFSYRRGKQADLANLDIQGSANMVTWQTIHPSNDQVLEDHGDWERRLAEIDVVPSSNLFLRLAATPTGAAWVPASMENAPQGASQATAIWTGDEMIVWGGRRDWAGGGARINTGGLYHPESDTWEATSLTGAPSARAYHTAVWTGSEMIVWGGEDGNNGSNPFGDGARYDPSTDTWTPMSMVNAPSPRSRHVAVWTGSEMIVWGGKTGTNQTTATGAKYDPSTDTWTSISMTNAPDARKRAVAVWTGSEMLVWGGENGAGDFSFGTGAHYNPVTDEWDPIPMDGAPEPRSYFTPAWTGSEMVIWGGFRSGFGRVASGGLYDPVAREWRPIGSDGETPELRNSHAAVWTGNAFLVFGGFWGDFVGNGYRYDPVEDLWTALPGYGSPTRRHRNLGVWTGSEFITWGGNDGAEYLPDAHRLRP